MKLDALLTVLLFIISLVPKAILTPSILSLLVIALAIGACLGIFTYSMERYFSPKTTGFPHKVVPGISFGMFYSIVIMLGLDFEQGQVHSKAGRGVTMTWK